MKLESIKDEIAKKYDFKDWDDLLSNDGRKKIMLEYHDEVAQLYLDKSIVKYEVKPKPVSKKKMPKVKSLKTKEVFEIYKTIKINNDTLIWGQGQSESMTLEFDCVLV